MSTILADFKPHHVSLFGEHILHLKHRLAESALFSDAALARLIENTPPAHLYVNTMDKRSHNPRSRREGAIDGLSGAEALEAVRAGNIWINIHKLGETDPAYAELLDEIFGEFEGRVPGLKTYKRSMTLLISSPKVQRLLPLRRARPDALADARREARLSSIRTRRRSCPSRRWRRSCSARRTRPACPTSRGSTTTPRRSTSRPARCSTGRSTARTASSTTTA